MGNKQRMPIRAEGPHVGTDPVSVRTRDDKDGIRYAVGRPNWQRDGQTRGLSLHAGLRPEWESLSNQTRVLNKSLSLPTRMR